jgi:hypothetical protein
MCNKSALVVFGISILMLVSRAKADIIGGVNFGSAGPSNWGVLELGGSGAAGYGASGAQVSINGPNAGVYGTATQANIGIADGGKANFSGTTLIQGALDEASTHGGNSISGTTIVGGQDLSFDFSTVALDAGNGLTTANALTCSVGFGALCGTALNPGASELISPVNPGGQNVLTLSSITLGNGITVTLGDGGSAATTWVILDSGDFNTSGGSFPITQGISLGSLLTPFSDLIVVNGKVAVSGGGNDTGGGSTVINGVLVVPNGTASFTPGHVNGEVIGGADMSFASGAQVNVPAPPSSVPEPTSVVFLFTVLAAIAMSPFGKQLANRK